MANQYTALLNDLTSKEKPLKKFRESPNKPLIYTILLEATEKLSRPLVVEFTLGHDTDGALTNFTILVDNGRRSQETVDRIIQDKMRGITSDMGKDEPLHEQKCFRDKVFRNVQDGVERFGLRIYNVNVSEIAQANPQKAAELGRTEAIIERESTKKDQCKNCEVYEMANAYDYLADALGGPVGLLIFMMLANVRNTCASEGGATADPQMAAASIQKIFQTTLLSTINDRTSVKRTMNASVTPGINSGNRVNGF